mmetsp:Transcript_14573/g.12829  ORF Transcript_14573/g.12829 Transcript_14573/m.12829 type:complete len:140 (+) Transcript_14573:276-695(+)
MISPAATCQIVNNENDIYGTISILQDSVYTSIITIHLSNILPGEYSIQVHENEINGDSCMTGNDPFLFGLDQEEYSIEVEVNPSQDLAIPTSNVNVITESELFYIYGNNTLVDKSLIVFQREEGEINIERLACCTIRFL